MRIFSRDASTRHDDGTDAGLFSGMVAQQVLGASTDAGSQKHQVKKVINIFMLRMSSWRSKKQVKN
jgi:hypothetical protein